MILCHKEIRINDYKSTYCMLPRGHDGPCPILWEKKPRCESVSKESKQQCGLPKNHYGRHSNRLETWE